MSTGSQSCGKRFVPPPHRELNAGRILMSIATEFATTLFSLAQRNPERSRRYVP